MNYIVNKIFTLIFFIFTIIVALSIPVHASINHPIFYQDQTSSYDLNKNSFEIFKTQGFIFTNIGNERALTIAPEPKKYSQFDLHVNFDKQNFLQNYSVVSSNFQQKEYNGEQIGSFVLQNNSLILLPNQTSIFNQAETGLKNFSISYTLMPYQTGEGEQTIFMFSKTKGDQKAAIKIFISKGIIQYHFDKFFKDIDGKSYSFILQEQAPLIDHKMESHSIVVNTGKKYIRIYRNGIEQDVRYLYGDNKKSLFNHTFENARIQPIVIGQNATFALDHFTIFNDAVFPAQEFSPNKMNFFETKVVRLSDSTSILNKIDVNIHNLGKTSYSLAYRFSEDYFFPETSSSQLPWIYIDPEKQKFPPSYSQGKYIQWRFEYFNPVEPSSKPFVLRNIKTVFRKTFNPGTVEIQTIVPGDGKIEIHWNTIPNELIAEYEIYYGEKPSNYFGVAEISPASPINIPIQGNTKSTPMSYTIEGLDNNKIYYISIRAKNIYGSYSEYSKEKSSIPSSINNGIGYSIGR